jgi:hypothetical protein
MYGADPLNLRVRNREARVRGRSLLLTAITLLALGTLAGVDASAQAPVIPSLEWPATVGQRVRATLPSIGSHRIGVHDESNLVTGTVAALTPDTLYVRPHPDAGAVAVPRPAIRALALSRGRSRTRTALRWGFNGLLLGVAAAAVFNGPLTGDRAMAASSTTLVRGGLFGAGLGAWTGAWLPREDWRRLPFAVDSARR